MNNQIIAELCIFKPGPDEAPTAASLELFRPNGDHYLTLTLKVVEEPESMREIVRFFEEPVIPLNSRTD
jgi:hypothetical protein